MGQYKFNSMEKAADGFHEVLTLDWFPGAIGRFFGHKKQTYRFYGNCTVWHAYPNFERCSISMELLLSSFWHCGKNKRMEEAKAKKTANETSPCLCLIAS